MFLPTAAMAAGILLSSIGAGIITAACIIGGGIGFHLVLTCVMKDPLTAFKINKLHYIWLAALFLGVGIISAELNRPYTMDLRQLEKYSYVRARIRSISYKTSGDRVEAEVLHFGDTSGYVHKIRNMKIILKAPVVDGNVDDEVVFPAIMSKITDNPNYFPSAATKILNNRGLYYQATFDEGDMIKYVGHTSTLMGIAEEIRGACEIAIGHTKLSRETKRFLISILLGDKDYLDPEMRKSFSDAGISHILALSGMHVAIISGIILFLLFPMNFKGWYRQRLVVSCILLFGYAMITGFAPSTVRAVIMASTVCLCIWFERKNSAWNALLLATFIILLFQPLALYDIGMQLSFTCVASLIFFANRLNPFSHHDHPWLYSVATMICACIVTAVSTWALSAYYFGTIPTVFLPANLIVLPLLPVYLTIGIAHIVISWSGLDLISTQWLLDWGFKGMTQFIAWLNSTGQGPIEYTPSGLTLTFWLLTLCSTAICLNARNRIRKAALCTSVILLGSSALSIIYTRSDKVNNGFIVQHSYQQVKLLTRSSGQDEIITFPYASISSCTVHGKNIIVAASLPDSVHKFMPDKRLACDLLIISRGYKGDIALARDLFNPALILIHNSMRRDAEKKLLHQADSLGIPVHSLRTQSPYRFVKD